MRAPSFTGSMRVALCAALLALAAGSCSRNGPSQPELHSIAGHVKLTGYLVDSEAHFAGTKVVGDADGVVVELAFGNRIVARTTTAGGIYHFSGLGPGGYVARTHLAGILDDTTEVLTVARSDVSATDTLRLVAVGDLVPTPNPFVTLTQVYFEVADSEQVTIDIRDMGGARVRSLLNGGVGSGLHQVDWDGRDDQGHPVTGPMYWMTFVAPGDVRAHILFR